MALCINAPAGEARRSVGSCHADTYLAGTTGMTQTTQLASERVSRRAVRVTDAGMLAALLRGRSGFGCGTFGCHNWGSAADRKNSSATMDEYQNLLSSHATESPSQCRGGQGAGASVFGVATQQSSYALRATPLRSVSVTP